MEFNPGRVAALLGALAGLLAAVAPAVANLDTSSTVGVVGGVLAIAAVVRKWLDGWQAHEYRLAYDSEPEPDLADPALDDPDHGDPPPSVIRGEHVELGDPVDA